MKYTNKHGLPDAFHRAVSNDPYSKGESDFSATGLQQPPRAIVLLENNRHRVEVDISSRVATTIGQGVHSILERAMRPGIDIIETRYYAPFVVDGVTYVVSAQIDLFEGDTRILYDWKTTKAYAFHKKNGSKAEWEAQLNIGALLMSLGGKIVKEMRIIGLLKDWDKKRAQAEVGYPATEIMELQIRDWPPVKTTEYITTKIRAIVQARKELPKCTTKDHWAGRRCAQWCDAASVCTQYHESILTGLIGGEE